MVAHTKSGLSTSSRNHRTNNMIMLFLNLCLFAYSVWQYVLSRGTGDEATWIALMAFNAVWLLWNLWQYKHHIALE